MGLEMSAAVLLVRCCMTMGSLICYADTAQPLIDQLIQDGGYSVELLRKKKTMVFIDQVQAMNSILEPEKVENEIFKMRILITTSVGAIKSCPNRSTFGPSLTKRFQEQQQPINIFSQMKILINASLVLKKR